MASNRFLSQAVRLAHSQDDVRSPSTGSLRRLGGTAICVALAASLLAFQSVAVAAEAAASEPLMEVVVTGSSIAQRLDTSSLPVQIYSEADIAKTGLTSASDLLQNLPAVQGFVAPSASVNGGGGGVTTAAIHSLPSKYTLVLIDGQRVAGFALNNINGGGYGVNLESIPLDAVERVEVLTDGASALYGADAIAGVVNFILKKDRTDGNVFYNASMPTSTGGSTWSAGLSKGFGDLKTDGYNILVTYSHDIQNKLEASQRPVSSRGAFFPFSFGGQAYIFNARTSNTEPANLIVGAFGPNGTAWNPFFLANNSCGGVNAAPLAGAAGTECRFNYAATVEDIPSYVRDSGIVKGTFRLGENTEVWGEVLVSQFDLVSQYAPPAQPLGLSPTQYPTLWNNYVVPQAAAGGQIAGAVLCTLAQAQSAAGCPAGSISSATLGYRAVSVGGRTDDWSTYARHIAAGFNTSAAGWDFKGMVTVSHGKATDTAAGGYLDGDQFQAAIAANAYDPVQGTGVSSIKAAILNTQFSVSNSDITAYTFGAQHKLFDMGGGPSILSFGGEYDFTRYVVDYSSLSLSGNGTSTQPSDTDTAIGGGGGAIPFEADRGNYGIFGEWLLPIRKDLNVTASLRYDSYQKVHSTTVFSGTKDPATGLFDLVAPADLGNTFSDTTYKVSFRYTPIDIVSFRGSLGTGFRAPALSDVAGFLGFAGSTSGTYGCPFPGSAGCLPGSAQYDLLAGPNALSGASGLQPEKSTQWSFGVRVDPVEGLSLAVDFWNASLKNQIESQGIAEQVGFNNPQQYAGLFVNPYTDPVGNFTTIGFEQLPFNGGTAHYSGIDWNFNYRVNTGIGKLAAIWTGTYMLKQEYTNGPGMPTLTDLGVFGPDSQVVFRTMSTLALSLQTGKWNNTLSGHYKSGYTDEAHPAGDGVTFLQTAGGGLGASAGITGIKVPDYMTLDWQTTFDIKDSVQLAVGVRNLTDKAPPLSLQTGGGGNQIGYDGRYYDPTGRTYIARIAFKF